MAGTAGRPTGRFAGRSATLPATGEACGTVCRPAQPDKLKQSCVATPTDAPPCRSRKSPKADNRQTTLCAKERNRSRDRDARRSGRLAITVLACSIVGHRFELSPCGPTKR